MGIKINCEETLSNYIIETKVNGSIVEKDNIPFCDVNNKIIQLEILIKFEKEVLNESFFQKFLFYLFGFLFIYFNSVDDFLESNEYLIQLIVEDFNENSDLNISLKEENSKLVTEITNNNCNIINKLIETKINYNIYNQKLKRYKIIRLISSIILMIFPTYFLIMSLIYKMYDVTLIVSILELVLILFLIILSKKK